MSPFIERLKGLRASRGLSQRQLSESAGLGRSLVSMLESGAREPRTEHLIALADFFGVEIDYLLGRADATAGTPAKPSESEVLAQRVARLSARDKALVASIIEWLEGGEP